MSIFAELYFFENLEKEAQERAISDHRERHYRDMGSYPEGANATPSHGMYYKDGKSYSEAATVRLYDK